jgi:signal transduction histidine kinase
MTLSVAVDDVKIHGDETLLLSLLVNLVANAARASKSGAVIKVKVYSTDDGAVFEVIDSGRGLAEEEIEKISAPFYRVDKSRSREFGGIGLGLSIVSQIVAIHNARLEINSVQDIGTTVRICFLSE